MLSFFNEHNIVVLCDSMTLKPHNSHIYSQVIFVLGVSLDYIIIYH